MDFWNNTVVRWIGGIITIATFIGIVFTVEAHFAKSSEMEFVSSKVDRHLIEERIDYLEKRIYKIEDIWTERYHKRHGEYPEKKEDLIAFMDEDTRETYRELVKELEDLEKELERLTKKKE